MIIVGIDPSLTATGVAVIDTDDHLVIDTHTITSTGRADAPLHARLRRIQDLAGAICWHAHHHDEEVPDDPRMDFRAELVVIEAPSLGQTRQGGTLDRHGLWWSTLTRLDQEGIPCVAVTPATRAKYATGKGNAGKDEVLLAVAKRYPHADVTNNNEADALILAAIGARLTGHPIEDNLPKTHLDALTKFTLPDGWAAA